MDPHLNVFCAYRGSADSDEVRERQLEDNLTRGPRKMADLMRLGGRYDGTWFRNQVALERKSQSE